MDKTTLCGNILPMEHLIRIALHVMDETKLKQVVHMHKDCISCGDECQVWGVSCGEENYVAVGKTAAEAMINLGHRVRAARTWEKLDA